ncbi:thiosulfate utilization transporter TsuA/YeeE [Enterobacter hormaechei]|uniref:thiosulfate utilization transporter TsuA/YeeE n=1 Tax=Enterobacteriaceae TaxID=543 RepID=UPI00077B786F|nr:MULTISPECIES: thiosulfate utilization transporter TsuA/YeeE [Enterobacteriaceae]EKZ9487272.1 YeeE/YedE family protein [Enterobacter hormaechei]MBF1949303.1 YeeE/YedE family protein [Enterobacter hormaechei]MCE1404220.1 YeeE/YedE family protein [Enterobacter hormaechei]MCM7058123.1 YeeE/YedE family protein [Enterobacter hormaechei]MCV2339814.1 YeeE/YedE family protein [Enterobacter hormaechei]
MPSMILSGLFCGALLGFVMQRGRFCLTGGFRDMYIAKNNRMFYALLIAIAIQSVGVFTLIQLGVVQYDAGAFPWLGTIAGGYIFGLGIVYAGGCATGTWYRAGEGLIGSWIALATYMVMSAVMRSPHAEGLNQVLKTYSTEHNSIAATLGLSVWPLIALLVAVTLWVVRKELKKPKLRVATLPPRRRGLAHLLFEKRWHPFVTAVLIGLIALLAWPLSEATGRMFGLGITSPTANILQFLVAGQSKFLNWGVFLVLGIFLGSFIAAKASREFRVRAADAQTTLRSAAGGLLMGVGASMAGGCSIGNGLVMTAMMTWQGWVGLVFMILGVWTASWFLYVRPQRKAKLAAATA